MELKNLLKNIDVTEYDADMEAQMNEIRIDSREVSENDVFVCLEGVNADGNDYLGTIGVPFVAVTQKRPPRGVKYVLVKDARLAYATMCENRFLRPLDDMRLVAVVGTNGKTSTAHYIENILSFAGFKCGLMGTDGHYIMGVKAGESLTTPDPYEFNDLLFKMRAKGCDTVIAEVSAHAIYLEKLGNAKADIAVLTNISQDHLDFFKSYDEYCGVKMSYFTPEHIKRAVINVDDKSGRILLGRVQASGLPAVSYGLENPADCFAVNVREDMDGVSFVANLADELVEVRSRLYGEFNVYNLLAAMTVAHELGVDERIIAQAVRKIKPVKGRFSVLRNEKGTIIIDFAHTPEGLRSLLSTARTLTKSRLITVFGCGGDRDVMKRRLMGEVASKYSDEIVLTSDNPRSENPSEIINDIASGVCIRDVKCITDRTEAVRFALSEMEEGDTLVLAGKGSENYIEIKGRKIPYSDFDAVARYGQLK